MEGKPTKICVGGKWHTIRPVERKLCLGTKSLSLKQVRHRKGGLIIGEGDTGKSTYVTMLEQYVAKGQLRPIFARLRLRRLPEIPEVPDGKRLTIILDGLDEWPECAQDIVDFTSELSPEKYHVWVTSRPGSAASRIAQSPLLEDVYHLDDFTEADIRKIADSVNLDGTRFLAEVHGLHLESFLRKPGGAVILMQLFANHHLKGLSRTKLMESIMRDFAMETRDGGLVDNEDKKVHYTEQQIVDATCWIATCLMMTGKDAIWKGSESDCPLNDIPLSQIPPREYSEALFSAALGLRLFEPLSSQRYRLAYSEMPPFLAGRWLAHFATLDDIKELVPQKAPYFTDEQASVLAWASCYKPELGQPWLPEDPEMFLLCHDLIKDYGLRRFFDLLVLDYRMMRVKCPPDLFNNNIADLSGFDDFIDLLQDVIDDESSDDEEIAIAAVLLEHSAFGNEEVAESLVARLLATPFEDNLNNFRLLRALSKICGNERFPCLAELEPLLKVTADNVTLNCCHDKLLQLCKPSLYVPPKVIAPQIFLSEDEGEDYVPMTEQEVAEVVTTKDPAEFGMAESGEVAAPDPHELRPQDEELFNELYPEKRYVPLTDDELEKVDHQPDNVFFFLDEYESYVEERQRYREELYYEHLYREDCEDDEPEDEEDPDRLLDEEGETAPLSLDDERLHHTLIDRIVRDQESRGLMYFSLTGFFKNYFSEPHVEFFIYPKLLVYAINQDPERYLPMVVERISQDLTAGIDFLRWVEQSNFTNYVTKGLDLVPTDVVVNFYLIILSAHKMLSGAFISPLERRILKDPSEQVEEDLDMGELAEIPDEVPVSPEIFDEVEDAESASERLLEEVVVRDSDVRDRLKLMARMVHHRREALGGKLGVSLEDLAAIGVHEPVKPVTKEDVKEVVQDATEEVKETVKTIKVASGEKRHYRTRTLITLDRAVKLTGISKRTIQNLIKNPRNTRFPGLDVEEVYLIKWASIHHEEKFKKHWANMVNHPIELSAVSRDVLVKMGFAVADK